MTWNKLDDGMWCHPKFLGISMAARGAWVMVLSWAGKHLTNGVVPKDLPSAIGIGPELVAELQAARLWDRGTPSGWVIHNYLRYNPSKAEVLAIRESGKQRAAKSYTRKKGAVRYESSREEPALSSHVSSATPDPVPVSSSLSTSSELSAAVASLPAPALKPPVTAPPASPAGRASRLIHEATLVEFHPVGKKWRPALEALGAKPDSEWKVAAEVLRAEALKPRMAQDVLNPEHILAHWHLYSIGQAPGQRQPLLKISAAANGVGGGRAMREF